MKTNKFYMMVLFALLIIMTSCKDDANDPTSNKKMRLKTKIFTSPQYGAYTYLYSYDNQGRLKIDPDGSIEFFYNTEGTLNRVEYVENLAAVYHYKNGKIDYIEQIGFHSNLITDTLVFSYGADGQLVSTKISNIINGIINETRTEFSFDINNRLLTRFGWKLIDNVVTSYDSTYYNWDNNGNLTEVLTRQWNGSILKKIEYEYDNKPNYYKTANYPAEFLYYNSLFMPGAESSTNNNIAEIRTYTIFTDSIINNISSYNELGYPLMINTNGGTWELQYEEY